MSESERIAYQINEPHIEQSTKGVVGLIFGVAIKYGLPSVCCIWLFYVIFQKDQIILSMAKDVTAALVESSHSRSEQTAALRELSDAVKDMNRSKK